ncbi:MAG TPA: phosphohistidine phosphatase SixA [Candidatus Nitrosotenuis sp.]|nr:phosphohistidine phosphatase SixA [Candidatus Nitrosotenuis sp.]
MRLYLVRHGIAIDREDPECPADPERFLTKKGIEKTRAVAAGLMALGLQCDAMYSSPYLRARQTAEIVASALHFAKSKIRQTEALLPMARPADFLKLLTRERGEVFAVGHAPNLDEVIAAAIGARSAVTALKKAGVACIEWEVIAAGKGMLIGVWSPRILRQLGGYREG